MSAQLLEVSAKISPELRGKVSAKARAGQEAAMLRDIQNLLMELQSKGR